MGPIYISQYNVTYVFKLNINLIRILAVQFTVTISALSFLFNCQVRSALKV